MKNFFAIEYTDLKIQLIPPLNLPGISHKRQDKYLRQLLINLIPFKESMTFNYKDVYAKYGDHFPCALTGRPIDFNKPHTYEYDHILPTSRGGDNTLSNLQIVCPEVNRAKQNLTDEEFLDLCKEVVIHHGHKIYKPVDL